MALLVLKTSRVLERMSCCQEYWDSKNKQQEAGENVVIESVTL